MKRYELLLICALLGLFTGYGAGYIDGLPEMAEKGVFDAPGYVYNCTTDEECEEEERERINEEYAVYLDIVEGRQR